MTNAKKTLQWCNGYIFIRVLASSVVDRGFEPKFGQTKNYAIGICCFSTKHEALRRKSKDWLTRNQDNVSELGDNIKIQRRVLVQHIDDEPYLMEN